MKTAEKILELHFGSDYHFFKNSANFVHVVEAMKEHAEIQVKKHLELAADNAMVHQHSRDYKTSVKAKTVRQKIMVSKVDKPSITLTTINIE